MPYIKAENRPAVENFIDGIVDHLVNEDTEDSRAGILNYTISSIISRYLQAEGVSYNRLNSLIGVLECAKLEIYRKVAVPYERNKCIMNGEVFPKQDILHEKQD